MKKDKPKKPSYNTWQNTVYYWRHVWQWDKGLLFWLLFGVAVSCATSLADLYLPKTVVAAVESAMPVGRLVLLLALYTAALMLLRALPPLINWKTWGRKIYIRNQYIQQINHKHMTTDYQNLDDPNFRVACDRANHTYMSNSSPTEALLNTCPGILTSGVLFVVYLLLLTNVNLLVLAVAAVTSVLAYVVNRYVGNAVHRRRDEYDPYHTKLNYVRVTARADTAAKDIRIFGMKDWFLEMYRFFTDACIRISRKNERSWFFCDLAGLLFSLLRNGVAYGYLIALVLGGRITVPDFVLYFAAVGSFTAQISGLLSQFATLHNQSRELCYLRECLDWPEVFKREEGEPLPIERDASYEITLKNVYFRYPGAAEDTIKGIDLHIPAGQKLAIIGLNGAGKSTLVKLICGFYDPTEGQVLLNGRDIRDYDRRDYYRLFSAVFQEFSVLASTFAENISQCLPKETDMARVRHCAALAGIDERLEALPNGYDTHCTKDIYDDGVWLSGGETQKLMLARALYKDAPVVVLDEPTAALDPIAESALYQRYSELTQGRTSLYISHRLASTRFCDRIILIENGKIAEDGTHESLMRQNGKYADLIRIQSKYYREGGAADETDQTETALS